MQSVCVTIYQHVQFSQQIQKKQLAFYNNRETNGYTNGQVN